MSLWNSKSISSRLTRIIVMASGIALLLAYLAFLAYDLISLHSSLINSVDTEAAIIGTNTVAALEFDDPQAARTTMAALRESPHVLWAVILRPDGTAFADYEREPATKPDLSQRLLGGESDHHWSRMGSVLIGRTIFFSGHAIGSVYVLAETSDLAHRVKEFGLISAGILLVSFLIAIAATSAVRNVLTGPLTDLAKTAQIVSRERNYTVRAPTPPTEDELAFLVRSFNEMLNQIQQRDRALEDSRAALELRVQERTEELVAANKELEAFSYSVAHDLRGPLQHISNISFLMQHSDLGKQPDGALLIEKLFEGSRRMSTLIDDLLNLSRATSTIIHSSPIDLSELAGSVAAGLEADNPHRNVEVTIAKGASVIADEGLLTLVFENLFRNAWKYTSKKDLAKIEFGFYEEKGGLTCFVRDNGVGFNPEYADRLFRPFKRLHSQAEFPGTGVGLATVHRIIARHGGRVWGEGRPGEGATFFFYLPFAGSA